jgi:uncharacterized membrane protein YfcA
MADTSIAVLAELAVLLVVSGVLVGFLAGLFGVGGGAVMVPILFRLFELLDVPADLRIQLAVGTSLAVIVPTAIRSYARHRKHNVADPALIRAWAIPMVLGVALGIVYARFAPAIVFKAVFIGVASITAIKLAFGRESWRLADDLPGEPWRSLIGFVIGVLSALMGIGGGNISNLIMTLCGRTIHQAVATSAGVGILVSIPGALGYIWAGLPHMERLPPFSIGFVSLIGAVLIAPTSLLAAPYGVALAHRLSKRRLEIAFAIFLAVAVIQFILSLYGY